MIKRDNLDDSMLADQAKEQTLDYEELTKLKSFSFNCLENLNSLSNECLLETADASFKHIDEVLLFLSKISDSRLSQVNASREPAMYKAISSLKLKAIMLSDLTTKSADEYVSPGILKVLLECVTMQTLFQKEDSMIIEVLPDNTLRISGEQTRENEKR